MRSTRAIQKACLVFDSTRARLEAGVLRVFGVISWIVLWADRTIHELTRNITQRTLH